MLPNKNDSVHAQPLGLTSATALVVANMIGTGIFTTSGFLLADLHSRRSVLAVWALGGVVATLGAINYGALARRIPESGGEYLFLSRTLHPAAGYIAGWISLLVGFSAPLAAAAFGFGAYTQSWLNGISPQITGTLLILIFAAIHAADVQRGARIQNAVVLLKVALIIAFIGFALVHAGVPEDAPAGTISISGFAVSLVWVSFSYSGWNAAIYIAGEVADAERTLPRALYLGTLLVTVLYLGLNAAFLFSTSSSELSGKLEIGRIAARALGGPALAEAVTVLIAIALMTAVSAMIMAGPRVYARMAADGCLPQWLAAEHETPRAAIALQAAIALVMLWTVTYDGLLTYIGFTLNLCTGATVLGLIRLRIKEPQSVHVPGWPWTSPLFLIAVLWMTLFSVGRRPLESLLGFITIGAGWLIWRLKWTRPRH